MNPEFRVDLSDEEDMKKLVCISSVFDYALGRISVICPEGREFEIMKQKLEEACFYAKKAIFSVTPLKPSNKKDGCS